MNDTEYWIWRARCFAREVISNFAEYCLQLYSQIRARVLRLWEENAWRLGPPPPPEVDPYQAERDLHEASSKGYVTLLRHKRDQAKDPHGGEFYYELLDSERRAMQNVKDRRLLDTSIERTQRHNVSK